MKIFVTLQPFHRRQQEELVSVQSATKMAAQKTTCKTNEYFLYQKLFLCHFFYFILFIMDMACYISNVLNFMIPVDAVGNNILYMQQRTDVYVRLAVTGVGVA
jgi:hypothetical protein